MIGARKCVVFLGFLAYNIKTKLGTEGRCA
jgi:hypothetical protein